jgi:hypothetical protein
MFIKKNIKHTFKKKKKKKKKLILDKYILLRCLLVVGNLF